MRESAREKTSKKIEDDQKKTKMSDFTMRTKFVRMINHNELFSKFVSKLRLAQRQVEIRMRDIVKYCVIAYRIQNLRYSYCKYNTYH